MMLLTALGYAIAFVLLTIVTVFMSAKIESKITFKEILDGFKRRWEANSWPLSFIFLVKTKMVPSLFRKEKRDYEVARKNFAIRWGEFK